MQINVVHRQALLKENSTLLPGSLAALFLEPSTSPFRNRFHRVSRAFHALVSLQANCVCEDRTSFSELRKHEQNLRHQGLSR
jgi:hypothetical protein